MDHTHTCLISWFPGASSAGYTPPDGSDTDTYMYKSQTLRGLSSQRILGHRLLMMAAVKFHIKRWVCGALQEKGIDPESPDVKQVRPVLHLQHCSCSCRCDTLKPTEPGPCYCSFWTSGGMWATSTFL